MIKPWLRKSRGASLASSEKVVNRSGAGTYARTGATASVNVLSLARSAVGNAQLQTVPSSKRLLIIQFGQHHLAITSGNVYPDTCSLSWCARKSARPAQLFGAFLHGG